MNRVDVPLITSRLPPVNEQPAVVAQFPDRVPVVTVTVPVVAAKLTVNNSEVMLNVNPADGVPDVEAVEPTEPPDPKSMLVASAAVGRHNATNPNKTARLIITFLLHEHRVEMNIP